MQPAFRINIRNLPRQVTPATCARSLSSTPRTMAFFPPAPQLFTPFFRLLDEVERSFPQSREAFTAPAVNHRTTASSSFSPRVNVSEEQTQYLLQAEIPGYEQTDVEIEWTDGNTLTISGRQQQQQSSVEGLNAATNVEGDKSAATSDNGTPASPALSAHQPSVEDAIDEDAPTNKDDWVDLPSVETESSSSTAAASTPATTVSSPPPPVAQPTAPQTKFWVKERGVGQFSRSFQFPNRVDHENVRASLRNGVLSVVVPKARVPEKRRVVVE